MSSTHVEALEALLRSPEHADNAEIKTALARLSSEIRTRLTSGSTGSMGFIEASVRALCRIKGTRHVFLIMECLCDSAQFLYSNGRTPEALKAAARCQQLAERTDDPVWMGRSQQLSGIVHADVGNVGEALICYSKALVSARRSQEVWREVATLNCLGVAYNYGGLHRHALPCLDHALSLSHSTKFREESSAIGPMADEYTRGALTNKAQSHLWLEEFDEGFAAIEKCIHETPAPWDALSSERRVIREATYVRLALELGKIALARQHVHDARQFALSATERARFYCEGTAALWEVHGGDSRLGVERLESILQRARSTPERKIILWDLAKAYDQLGHPELALDRARQLVACLKGMREEGLKVSLTLGLDDSALEPSIDTFHIREAMLRAKVSERRLAQQRLEMFERLALTADLKEEESGQHGYRVGKLAALMAERLHWTSDKIGAIESAGRLHDIGKIAMPDRILFSAGQLNRLEREVMAAHTTVGAELLCKGDTADLRMAEDVARHHHECWDGTGYPSKLIGKRIPIHARIVALADVFDALTHGRPYAQPWAKDRAIEEIRQRRGSQFDPDLTDSFLELIAELGQRHADLEAYLSEGGRISPFHQARTNIRTMLTANRGPVDVTTAPADTVH